MAESIPLVATASGDVAAAPAGAIPVKLYGGGSGGSPTPVSWAEVTGKPATFPPVVGTTATAAKAGNYQPAAADISDATATGRSVLTAADAAAARTAIGAGTSSLVIGTTATTAKAGNAVQTATQTTATAVGGGTATNVQGILAELAARIAALETA